IQILFIRIDFGKRLQSLAGPRQPHRFSILLLLTKSRDHFLFKCGSIIRLKCLFRLAVQAEIYLVQLQAQLKKLQKTAVVASRSVVVFQAEVNRIGSQGIVREVIALRFSVKQTGEADIITSPFKVLLEEVVKLLL